MLLLNAGPAPPKEKIRISTNPTIKQHSSSPQKVNAPTKYANLTRDPIAIKQAATIFAIFIVEPGHFSLMLSSFSSKSDFSSFLFLLATGRFFLRPDSSLSSSSLSIELISALSFLLLNYSRPTLCLGTSISGCSDSEDSGELSISSESESFLFRRDFDLDYFF